MTNRELECQNIFANSRGMLIKKSYLLEELGCSDSTLKRTINKLRDIHLVPLTYDRYNHGWRCDKNYTLPGIFFSDDELYAFLILEQLLENMDSGLIAKQLAIVKDRVKILLSTKFKTGVNLTDKLRFISIFNRTFNKTVFKKIAQAVLSEYCLEISFVNKQTRDKSSRQISPQRLVHYKNNWYLDAFCHQKNDFRTFAIDGIKQVKKINESIQTIPSDEIDYLTQGSYGIFSGQAKKIAKLNFYPPVSFWIAKEKWHPKQQTNWLENDVLELQIPYNKEEELVADILRYAANVKVISPESLRLNLIKQANTLIKNNS